MIKFVARRQNGRRVLGLGLSRARLEQLLRAEGSVFHIDGDVDIIVVAGESEQTMFDKFMQFLQNCPRLEDPRHAHKY